jgi:4-diphosphocytidyl-2C-methyl-D-erythritol kinase
VLLLLPDGAAKESTGAVYRSFDERDGAEGFAERARRLRDALAAVREPDDLAALPPNDLASSELATELLAAGAFRADVSGAGPTLYGLFRSVHEAEAAADRFAAVGRVWIVEPRWYN